MNLWVSANPFNPQTGPSNAIAVRKRLMNPVVRERQPVAVEEVTVTNVVTFAYRCQQPKDAHVRAWQWHVAQEACKVQRHIRKRCEDFGVSVDDVTSEKRSRHIVEPRQVIMYELKAEFNLTYPEIGRRMGGRDHTTAIHACRKIAARMAAPPAPPPEPLPVSLTPEQLDIVRLRAQGHSNKEVDAILGIKVSIRKWRIVRALAATGAGNMAALVEMSKRMGWIE